MNIFIITTGVLFTILSAIVLSYVSIATNLGPWIGSTLVLMGAAFSRFRLNKHNSAKFQQEILLIQAIGAGGGTIATGIGFSLPILYFLDTATFNRLLQDPYHFCGMITFACLAAGTFGIFLGRVFSSMMLHKNDLLFPVSQLIYKTATSQTRNRQAKSLFLGVWFTLCIGVLRDGFLNFVGVLPRQIYLFEGLCGAAVEITLRPTLWAIGFTSGVGIIVPLLVGLLSKYVVLYPLQVAFFSSISLTAFTTAFCAGLGVAELVIGFYANMHRIFQQLLQVKRFIEEFVRPNFLYQQSEVQEKGIAYIIKNRIALLELSGALISSSLFFFYLGFSFPAQILLLCLTILATYEISYIGCKIGLVQFGRFSTLVLIPMLIFFNLNFMQITASCLFFNVCAAVASDLIFDYKVGEFGQLKRSQVYVAQWIGLLATALSIGLILYLFFNSFVLGSADFFGYRSQSKAFLIQTFNFNYYVVLLGFLYGLVLKQFRLSPTMTFGGILMPNNISIGLLLGALASYGADFTQKKEDYIPFCSGIFASESLWIIISATLKLV